MDEVGGSLPVWSISVSHYFYAREQRWASFVTVYEQRSEDDVELHHQDQMHWGPFDTVRDITDWTDFALRRALTAQGAPWDAGQSAL